MSRLIVLVMLAASARLAIAQGITSIPSADAETSLRLRQIVESVRSRGLPIDPIVAKVRYASLVAHAPPSKIVAAAEAVAQRLETARTALAPRPTDPEIDAGADAISFGVTPKALEALRVASPTRPVTVPIGVLTQLVTNRVPIDKATAIVTDLIRRGANDRQLLALGNDVNQDIAVGRKADDALEVRAHGLIPLLPAAGPSASAATLGPTTAPGTPKKP